MFTMVNAWYSKYGFDKAEELTKYFSKYYLWSNSPDYVEGLSRSKKKTRAKYYQKLIDQTTDPKAKALLIAQTYVKPVKVTKPKPVVENN